MKESDHARGRASGDAYQECVGQEVRHDVTSVAQYVDLIVVMFHEVRGWPVGVQSVLDEHAPADVRIRGWVDA